VKLCRSCKQPFEPRKSDEHFCLSCYRYDVGLVRCFAATASGARCRKWSMFPTVVFCTGHLKQGFMLFEKAVYAWVFRKEEISR